MARPRLTPEQLAVRGSRLAKRRAAQEAQPKRKPRAPRRAKWRPPTNAELDQLILEIPGYDPHRDSAGCWFDRKLARKVIKFFETELRHVEGSLAGKLFLLERWEKAILANLFGWVRKDDKGRTVRRFREVLIYVARKSGKTPLAAGISLYLLLEDGEAGAQIVSAAAKREQAALLFRHARGMVERSPYLSSRAQVASTSSWAQQTNLSTRSKQ